MQSQPLQRFLHFDSQCPSYADMTAEMLVLQANAHQQNFKRAIRSRDAVYPIIESGAELATLLLHALNYSLSKDVAVECAIAMAELKQPSNAKAVADLLCNNHATEFFSKAVRADYDNLFLEKRTPAETSIGLSTDHLSFPRVGHFFAPGCTKYYPFYCTLFVRNGRLTSSFEVMVEPSLHALQNELYDEFEKLGLADLVDCVRKSSVVRRHASHPLVAQGKQLAVPKHEMSLRQDDYLVVTPIPSVQMIYALDQAIDKHWASDRWGVQHMRIGGSKPHNMGSTVTNLGSNVPGEGAVNIRPLRSYVPPLRSGLYASKELLTERSLRFRSALNLADLETLKHFRKDFSNPVEFKHWVALLPAALFPVLEPLADLQGQGAEKFAMTEFKHGIEQQFVCKKRPEHLLGRRTNAESYRLLGQHVATLIEARLLIYKNFSAGLGVRRKMAITRSATALARAML